MKGGQRLDMPTEKAKRGNARPGSPRRGPGYPVTQRWQGDVKAEIERRGLTEKDLAVSIGCAQSTLHEMLNSTEARHSSLVPAIHRALNWQPPPEPQGNPLVLSPDAMEMAKMFDDLPDDVAATLLAQARTMRAALKK